MSGKRTNRAPTARWLANALACLALGLAPSAALAHGEEHLQMLELTRRINEATNNPAGLHLQRGELEREHGLWEAAAADFDRAAELDPTLGRVDLCRARLAGDLGDPDAALAAFNQAVTRLPDDGEAWIGRARIWKRLKERDRALADYGRGIRLFALAPADCYLEVARDLAAAERVAEALEILDLGIGRLKGEQLLQAYAVDLELQRGEKAAAVRRIDDILGTAMRKEGWFVRRGQVLLAANQPLEARESFRAAAEAIASLPPRLQRSPGVIKLQQEINSALPGGEADTPSRPQP